MNQLKLPLINKFKVKVNKMLKINLHNHKYNKMSFKTNL
jgi:hypothetical protein